MAIAFPGESVAPEKPDLEFIESFDNSQVGGIEKFGSVSTDVIAIEDVVAKAGDTMTGLLAISSGGLSILGGILRLYRTAVASNYSTGEETFIGITDTSFARTITLDTADCVSGRIVIVKDESGGAATHNITVDTQGAETIDGAATATISANYGTLRLYSNGSNWFIF